MRSHLLHEIYPFFSIPKRNWKTASYTQTHRVAHFEPEDSGCVRFHLVFALKCALILAHKSAATTPYVFDVYIIWKCPIDHIFFSFVQCGNGVRKLFIVPHKTEKRVAYCLQLWMRNNWWKTTYSAEKVQPPDLENPVIFGSERKKRIVFSFSRCVFVLFKKQ